MRPNRLGWFVSALFFIVRGNAMLILAQKKLSIYKPWSGVVSPPTIPGRMAILLLPVNWIGSFWLSRELGYRNAWPRDWRLCWLLASITSGVVLTLIVEGLSLFSVINRVTLGLAWTIVDALIFGGAWYLRSRRPLCTNETPLWRERFNYRFWSADTAWMLWVACGLAAFLFLVGLFTATTNGDSLSYHLARMAHWIDHGNVNHYATDDARQLEFGPWSSYLLMNVYLLSGGERWLNSVQWFAMISSVLLLTWIVEELARGSGFHCGDVSKSDELRRRALPLTVLLAMTLPIGVVESMTTQNDYTTAFWLLCCVSCLLLLHNKPEDSRYAVAGAAAAGLGVLTKATTYIFAGPFIVIGVAWWLYRTWRDRAHTMERAIKVAVLSALAFAVLNAPHMLRNYALLGSPVGSREIFAVERNERVSLGVVGSNLLRNLALHCNTGVPPLSRALNKTLGFLHEFTGEPLSDPGTTYEHTRFLFVDRFFAMDSIASCAGHMLLAVFAAAMLLARPNRGLLLYTAPIIIGFVVLCAYLKWQPWHSRLHLAWFLLLVPVTVLLLIRHLPKLLVHGVAVALVLHAGHTLAYNKSRPLWDADFRRTPRHMQHLMVHDKTIRDPLERLADDIVRGQCGYVGIKTKVCMFEYPFWLMLRQRGFTGEFNRCLVEHPSACLGTTNLPDVIVLDFTEPPEAGFEGYSTRQEYGRLKVYWRATADRAAK